MHLKLKDDLLTYTPPRRYSQVNTEIINHEIQNLLNRGLIEPCISPYPYPAFLAKNGADDAKYIFVIDYRGTSRS